MAIGVSQAFKDAMQAPVKVVKATISADNGQTFESSDELISFSMEASGYYFGAVSKALDFSLLGTTYNLLDKDIHVVLSVLTDSTNDTWADCDFGNFRITEQKANLEKETTTFRAYDRVGMLAFDPYMEGGLTFPNTIANVVAEFADNYAFDYTPHTLTNGSYVIPEDLYKNINNITYRDILAEIAGATASIAKVDGTSNVLTLQEPLQTTSETWTYANLKSIKFQPKYGKISSVVLSRMPQEDNIVVTDSDTEHSAGGKNLFNSFSAPSTDNLTSKGISWSVNLDGSISTSGTTTGTYANLRYNMLLSAGDYWFGGCPDGGSINGYSFRIDVGNQSYYDYGNGGTFTLATDQQVNIYPVRTGGTQNLNMDGLVFRPIIVKGSSPVDYEPFVENGIVSLKLANNEILDDDREGMAQPILDAIKGFDFYPFEAETEGHGWHECGDRIKVTDGDNSWDVVVTYIKLTIDGGMKEVIKGIRPVDTQTDYSLAGGIMKTIYNTEIKVDKQGQEITSVVSRQEQFENETQENFSQVVQNISSITTTIQTTGGGNFIHNSVGYNKNSDGTLVHWEKTGTVTSESSPESVSYGAISGNQINLLASSSITQRIIVDGSGSQNYTFAFRAKKGATGDVTVHLQNEIDDYTITIPEGEAILWQKYSLEGVVAHSTYFDVIVETDASVTELSITDLMLTVGDTTTPWVQASDEILSKNVAVDSTGVKVSSNSTNDYVQLNELGLNGYSDASGSLRNVFTINRDLTEVEKLKSRSQISMPPIKIVPVTSGNRAGWCFVASNE